MDILALLFWPFSWFSDRKPLPSAPAPPTEADPAVSAESDLPKAPPPPHGAPPPLPHRPPPPPPSNYIMGMSTTSSYMSSEGYQSLQSLMKTDAPSYPHMPPSYGMPYHQHVYPPPSAPPPGPPPPPPPASYPPPNLPPPTPSYPPPGYNHSYPPPPPPRMPPPGMALPAGYPPPPVPPGQPQVLMPPVMPPVANMNRGAWMRWKKKVKCQYG